MRVYYMLISWIGPLDKGEKRRPMEVYEVYMMLMTRTETSLTAWKQHQQAKA